MKTFRKSSLITSVALLLVAIVALGGTTFAWFSTSSTADAKGIKASTTAASNLVVSEDGTNWGATVNYNTDDVKLNPTSTTNFANWWTNTADVYDGGTSTKANVAVAEENLSNHVIVKDLYIKNDGSANINVDWTLTITEAATGDADAFRVAFQKISGSANAEGFVWANANDDAPVDAEGNAASTIVTTTAKTGSLGELEAGVDNLYRFYIYYEGTDAQCIDSLAKNTCEVEIDFTKAD